MLDLGDSTLHNFGTIYAGARTTGGIEGSASAAVVNEAGATFRGESAATAVVTVNVPFTNSGTVVAQGGTLAIPQTPSYVGGTLTGGVWTAAAAVLEFAGPIDTNNADLSISGDGVVRTLAGRDALRNLTVNTGVIAFKRDETVAQTLTNYGTVSITHSLQVESYIQQSGITTVSGTLRCGPAGTKPLRLAGGELTGTGSILGQVMRGGTIHPTASGGNALSIGSWQTTPDSVLDVDLAASAGAPRFSQLSVAGAAALGGTLAISTAAGFQVRPGNSFTVVRAATVSGTFGHVTGRQIDATSYWQVRYTPTTVDLVATAAPALSVANWSTPEGDSGESTVVVPVTLSAPSDVPVTVGYATSDGTATAGADYTATSGTLTFPPGWTSRAISVPILGDTDVEPDETFTITLSNASLAALPDAPSTVTIRNDDPAGTTPAVLGVDPATIGQNSSGRVLTVTGSGFVAGDTVDFGTPDVTAAATSVDSATQLTVTVSVTAAAPLGPTDVLVHSPAGGVGVCNSCLDVTPAPHFYVPGPRLGQGAAARPVSIVGRNLVAGSDVTIGDAAGTLPTGPLVIDASGAASVLVAVPPRANAGRYTVTITNPDGGTGVCVSCYHVLPGPRLDTISPDTVARGTAVNVTITGSGFTTQLTIAGPRGVEFDSVAVLDDSTITARMVVAADAPPGSGRRITITDGAAGGYGSTSEPLLTVT